MDIYKNSFRNSNKNFDIFLHNIFEKKKVSKYKPISKIITHFNDQIFFEKINYSLKKKILQNLQNWGESNEVLVKSSFLLKEKGNLYISNYMKIHLLQFLKKKSPHLERIKLEAIFIEETLNYSYSELKNPKLCITLEDILSDTIYQFSRYLIYKTRKSKIQIKNIHFLTKKINKDIMHFFDSPIVNKNVKSSQFFNSSNFNQFRNLHIDDSNFEWIRQMLYLHNESTLKPVFIKRTFVNKFLSSLKKNRDSYFNFLLKSLMDKYIINHLFSTEKREKFNPKIFFFSKPLLIDEIIQNNVLKKINKISKNHEIIHQLKTNIESDDIEIISWKIRKYYSNFLLNYSLPFTRVYNIICQNYSLNKKIRYKITKFNWLFIEISNLFQFFSEFNKTFLLINCKEHLIIKTNELELIAQWNKIEERLFAQKIFLISRDNSDTYNNNNNKLINDYLLIKNLIQNNYYKYSNKLLNNLPFRILDSKTTYINNILHKNSRLWKINFKKSFIYNIFDIIKYKKFNLKISHWLYKIKNLSKEIIPYNFSIKVKFIQILKKYFKDSDSKKFNKSFHSLQISNNICSIDIESNKLFNEILIKNFHFTEREDINNWIANLFINGINDEIIIDLLTSPNWIKNEALFFYFNYKSNLKTSSIKFRSNYKKNFLFYLKKNNIENQFIIYSKFLKNLWKYDKLNEIFIKQRSLFFEKSISEIVQLNLNNEKLFKILEKKKFVSFSDFYQKISKQANFYFSTNSKIDFSKQEKYEIETIFTNKKVKIKGIHKNVLRDLNNIQIKNYYNILQYELLTKSLKRNESIFKLINQFFLLPILKYSALTNRIKNQILIHPDKLYYKSNQIENFHFFDNNISFKDYNYTFWFFTSEWWKLNINIFIETIQKHFVIIGSYFEYFIKNNNNIQLIQNNLVNFYKKKQNLFLNSKWNSHLFFDYTEEIILNFLWSDFQLINNLNNLYWAIFILMSFIFLFYQNYFSIFIGSDSIDLWKNFENIKYLTDTSRAFYFTKLLHRNKTQLNKTENLLIYFFSNLKHYAKNIRFYLLTKKKLNKWVISNKSLDLSRRKRNLLVQSLITPTRIKEYGFQFYYQPKIVNNGLFGYLRNPQQGISYLRYLSKMFKQKLINYSVYRSDKWIFFASLQKVISSQTLQQTRRLDSQFQKIPIPLQLGLSCSKGILLIGPIETGRSYLIKNLAADSSVPLLGISINKLLYNKPDIVTESWMNILIESLRRLNLILDLAKGMSPCIIWIRNIHQLDVNRSTQNIESDPTFLLGILLKHFQIDSFKTRTKNNIIIIGSTHVPKKVDPSLISPDRLDRVLNIRLLNTYQRKNQFPILLNRNNLQLNKKLSYFNEFGSRTMGYNIRDLVALTNETSLISLTRNKSFVYDDIVKLAFHRQVLGFSHTNNAPNYQQNLKNLLYKIGRAIIQNIMIEGSAINPLNINNYLWKRKFYYLSKWYSEPSMHDSIIKESTILVHILGSLAGIAARDSWLILEKDSDISISLDKSIENDLDFAFSLLETFSNDFPWLETCEIKFLNYKRKKPKIFLTKNFLNTMHNGIFAIANKSIINNQNESPYESLLFRNEILNRKIYEFNNTTWSPRFWRLNFSRSHLFSWIKRPNDFEFLHTFGLAKKKTLERKNYNDQLIGKKKEQFFYERILPRVRKRNVEELESQFENILLEEQFEILGFFGSSTQDQMEYQLENKPRLFIGKRILWDPISSFSQTHHFVFSRQEFFVDEEMLRRLYITYGVRRERDKSLSSHRIKRFFIYRGYNKDLINKLSVRWWNKLPIDQKENIYTLKRIEKIGIRLKRPQIFTPVYLYQRWLIENIPGKFSRLDLLNHRDRWMKINTLLLKDSFTYNILLESYQYLLKFFLSNKILLTRMTKTLLNKKWIFQNDIRDIIHDIKK
uniref:Hypothetical chloroplast RF21 n=1 Tax=Herbertus javanicus TaxID=2846788 RepID=A0A8F2XUZ0_9MARC|nr:hypothetical chloroplast RF21 [Herbertus javanicus]